MKKVIWLMLLSGLWHKTNAQSHGGVEQYYSLRKDKPVSVMPVIYYKSNDNWYVEGRYNYEAPETLSVYAGKTFQNSGEVDYSFSPMAGIVSGRYDGCSIGMNGEIAVKKMYLTTQCQYTISASDRRENFLYSWTDAGFNLSDKIATGLSGQYTKTYGQSGITEYGLFIQAAWYNWTLPLYLFNPGKATACFMLGINYEWKQNKDTNKNLTTRKNIL